MTASDQTQQRWQNRQWAATALRFAIAVVPMIVAALVVYFLLKLTNEPVGFTAAVLRLILISLIGYVVARAMTSFAQRLLPLAALLKLSLAFPDQAPSRFRLAVRATSNRALEREVTKAREEGLSSDRTVAAEQIILLTAAVGAHDRRTRGHSERVRLYAQMLGEQLGLDDEDLSKLQWGALLHDLGKVRVPTEVLNKPGKLDDDEWAIMRSHPAAGRELIAPLAPFLGEWAAATDAHHEKWDGSGYPLGLAGSNIPMAGRIVAVADSYEVMTATRSYKKPMPAAVARAELTKSAGNHFDPAIVRAFLGISVGQLRAAAGPVAFAMSVPFLAEFGGLALRLAPGLGSISAGLAGPATASISAVMVASANAGIVIPENVPEQTLAFVEEAVVEPQSDQLELDDLLDVAVFPDLSPATTVVEPQEEATTSTTAETLSSGTESTSAKSPVDVEASGGTLPTVPVDTSPTTQPTTTEAPTTTPPETAPADDLRPVVIGDGEIVWFETLPMNPDFTASGPHDHPNAFFVFYEGPTVAPKGNNGANGQVAEMGRGICSYYIFMAPGAESASESITLQFPGKPLSIVSNEDGLVETDMYGSPDAKYRKKRAFEQGDSAEKVTGRDAPKNSVVITTSVNPNQVDTVRILTTCP